MKVCLPGINSLKEIKSNNTVPNLVLLLFSYNLIKREFSSLVDVYLQHLAPLLHDQVRLLLLLYFVELPQGNRQVLHLLLTWSRLLVLVLRIASQTPLSPGCERNRHEGLAEIRACLGGRTQDGVGIKGLVAGHATEPSLPDLELKFILHVLIVVFLLLFDPLLLCPEFPKPIDVLTDKFTMRAPLLEMSKTEFGIDLWILNHILRYLEDEQQMEEIPDLHAPVHEQLVEDMVDNVVVEGLLELL